MRSAIIAVSALLLATPALAQLSLTPAQTEGPYYPTRLKPSETDNDLTRVGAGPQAKGDVLEIKGTVVDPSGAPIAGARVEIWQADHQGIYMHPADPGTSRRDKAFQFYGETKSDDSGAFSFRTIVPARYSGRARHIHAKVTPPGGATLTTQFYFKGDADLGRDGLAASVGKALADVSLEPMRSKTSETLEASVRVVVARARIRR